MTNSAPALALFSKLNSAGIVGAKGVGKFSMLGTDTTKLDKSLVGYTVQSWLTEWMIRNKIPHSTPVNSQESPDYFLPDAGSNCMLELKTFDAEASPNFDIANFEAFLEELIVEPAHLSADYLIMSYRLLPNGTIEIVDVWLKKLWDITGPMGNFPINVQRKKSVVYNIRPIKWASARSKYKAFGDKKTLLVALADSISLYRGPEAAEAWKKRISASSKVDITNS